VGYNHAKTYRHLRKEREMKNRIQAVCVVFVRVLPVSRVDFSFVAFF